MVRWPREATAAKRVGGKGRVTKERPSSCVGNVLRKIPAGNKSGRGLTGWDGAGLATLLPSWIAGYQGSFEPISEGGDWGEVHDFLVTTCIRGKEGGLADGME